METNTLKSKTRNLKHVKIYNELYELIKNGTYQAGSQLPPETTLSATMNVSRMTLRKALAFLREDGLIKDVPGVGHFVCTPELPQPKKAKTTTDNLHPSILPKVTLSHPIYNYCKEKADAMELVFRIEPPSKFISNIFEQYSAAVVIVDRWYKHNGHAIAYSLSFIPIETIGKSHLDLNSNEALSDFLEHTCYTDGHHWHRNITYSTAGNFSSENYKLSEHDSFLLIQEKIYDEKDNLLVSNKHYIPAELFELNFEI